MILIFAIVNVPRVQFLFTSTICKPAQTIEKYYTPPGSVGNWDWPMDEAQLQTQAEFQIELQPTSHILEMIRTA